MTLKHDKWPEWAVGCVRWFSPPLSFIETFVCRFGNDNYRDRYRLSTYSAFILPIFFFVSV